MLESENNFQPQKNDNQGEPSLKLNQKPVPAWRKKLEKYLLGTAKVPLKEKLFFTRNLAVMIRAGIPLLTAFRTLAEQTENKTFSKILKNISSRIEQGTTLTETLKDYPTVFNELFINMVESGELSGKLEEVFRQLHVQLKKQHELISKIKGALTYPVIVVCIMFGIGIFMMIYVVPKLLDVFNDLKAELPLPTKMLIAMSNALTTNGPLVLGLSVVVIALLIKALKTTRGKYIFQAIVLKLPIVSGIVKKINLARFARTVSSLLKTDIMIIETFRITANVVSNLHYRKIVTEVSERVKKGGQISDTLKKYPAFFPPMVSQMIVVGEQTGEIGNILEELALFYEEEVDQIMENLPSIIEPLLILLLGVGVGGMAVAIVLPMYSLTTSI